METSSYLFEVWKDIPGYVGYYQVSDFGRVRSVPRAGTKGGVLVQSICRGYYKVYLCGGGKRRYVQVHRLVAEVFIPNPNNYPCVDHIDTNRLNNVVSNLRWVTHRMNSNNPITRQHLTGENNPFYGKHHTTETRRRISEKMKKMGGS